MSDSIYQAIYDVAKALELPVVILALAALALVIVEAGAFVVESMRRRRRRFSALSFAANTARDRIDAADPAGAAAALWSVAWSPAMAATLTAIAHDSDEPSIAKRLADFDFAGQRKLARTRLLVRFGPALGLMGTLIPLAPALQGLADGDTGALADNLRIAFSVTVLGILVGAVAFAISLLRDRIYDQDHSDLEYVAAVLTAPEKQP